MSRIGSMANCIGAPPREHLSTQQPKRGCVLRSRSSCLGCRLTDYCGLPIDLRCFRLYSIPQASIGTLMSRSPSLDLLQGTLDLLILKTLSWGPAHGYAIARWIQQLTGHALEIGEGSLYPALHRLEERGWVEADWKLSENNRRAKFYGLTTRGRQQLRAETRSWDRF